MESKELQDEAMDAIVGGSTYTSDLARYICTDDRGRSYVNATWGKKSLVSKLSGPYGDVKVTLNDAGMARLIKIAEGMGSVTLYNGNMGRKAFTAAELKAML